MALFDDASLVVTPNGYKAGTLYSIKPTSGAGDMTVVRATTATRVNSAGLIELVPYNLFTYSEQFDNTDWQKISVTVTPNTTIAPNGTLTADTLVVSSSGYLYRQINYSASLGNSITMSIYTKNSDANFLIFAGATIAGTDVSTIVNVGDGWYRHIVTRTFTTSATGIIQFLLGYTFTGTYYIWGAQLNDGTIKDYLRTETRLNIPRLDYSNGSCPSLLVEPQRTNILLYSEQFENAYWGKYQTSLTANSVVSPDGNTTADTVTVTTGTGGSLFLLSPLTGTYTVSIFMKAGTSSVSQIEIAGVGNVDVNLSAGTFTTSGSVTGTIKSFGSGWHRCTATFTGTLVPYIAFGVTGTTGKTIYLWGAQLEAGSYPTSYIPTTSAAVTRNADAIYKTGISSLIGQTEGVLFLDLFASAKNNDANTFGTWIFAGNANNNFQIYNLGSTLYWYARNTGGIIIDQTANQTIVEGTRYKIAYAYKSGDYALYINGVQKRTSANANVPAVSQFNLSAGGYGAAPAVVKNEYNSAILFPTRLTNAELASLTTI